MNTLACGGGSDSDPTNTYSTTTNPFVSYQNSASSTSVFLDQLSINWNYDLDSNPAVNGFRVYDASGIEVCSSADLQALQTQEPQMLHIDCDYDASSRNSTFTMTAFDMDNIESAHSAPFVVNKAPVAIIYAGWDDATVYFDAGSSYDFGGGSIVANAWDFGDGVTSNNVTAEHRFAIGDHIITLEVLDDQGVKTTTEVIITIS